MQRLNHTTASPEGYQKLLGVAAFLAHSGLDTNLLELISMRASEINGCSWCLDYHSKHLRQQGETEQRLYGLVAWKEAPYYTERERAALAWTEAVTLIADTHVPDEVYEEVRQQFSEQELANLTMVLVAINGWNRFAISFRDEAGTYQPAEPKVAATV